MGVEASRVMVHHNSTTVIPNQTMTGGSVTSEVCVAAAFKACTVLNGRLDAVRAAMHTERDEAAKAKGEDASVVPFTVAEVCAKACGGLAEGFKTNLSAIECYAPKENQAPGCTPDLHEQMALPAGCYMTFGCAVSEVEVDLLSGDVRCLRSDVLFDAGESLNPLIDIGQAEGAWVMGQVSAVAAN